MKTKEQMLKHGNCNMSDEETNDLMRKLDKVMHSAMLAQIDT